MPAPRETHRRGLDSLSEVTALLQRVRRAHPTTGLYEAGDLLWWWRTPRSTDDFDQLFWIDADGRPVAAVMATDGRDRGMALAPIVMPDATPDWVAHVVERGLTHAREIGSAAIRIEVARDDHVLREVLVARGFALEGDGVVESWLAAEARPVVGPLHDGYRLASRTETTPRPHHLIERNGPDVEMRLRQTSLYRPELDLVVLDRDDEPAAYGLFWYDPETASGLVEPMRTHDDHQRRGLARHLLTRGVERLVEAGAERIKICFEPGNPAAKHLYLGVGFEPVTETDVYAGRADTSGIPRI